MTIWTYDNTFEGMLTLVFDFYEMKTFPDKISKDGAEQPCIFPGDYTVVTDEAKAKRVWTGLHKKISDASCQMLFYVFLSEMPDCELLILRYVKDVFESTGNIEFNFGNKNVLEVSKIAKKVGHERQRILMFARFQKTADDIYYASFDPAYDVLPLITEHFEKRFADQKWIIHDTRRNYGFYYDLKSTTEITFTESMVNPSTGKIDKSVLDKYEQLFQELWKGYFKSLCIKERINPKLHVQFLPRRYWKYLIEKQKSDS